MAGAGLAVLGLEFGAGIGFGAGVGGLLAAGGELADPTLDPASGSSPNPQAAQASTSNRGATVLPGGRHSRHSLGVSVRAGLGPVDRRDWNSNLSKDKAARLPFCVRRLAMRIYELLRGKGFDVITVRPATPVSEAILLLKKYNLSPNSSCEA